MVLFFHGGAYHLGSPARLRGLLARLSAAAQARVLSAGYRLAPEHPFPAAVEDALIVYRWLIAVGADARQVVISGDSSVAAWRLRRSWRCVTPATHFPARPSSSRRGPTWTWAASRCAAGRPSM